MYVSIDPAHIAPTGLYSLNSSTVTATAGESLLLTWLSFDVKPFPAISVGEPGAFIVPSGSLSERGPWTECLPPYLPSNDDQDIFINLNRPQIVQYVTSRVNIEEAGTYTLSVNDTFSSHVQVIGKHIVSELVGL